ncbi:MAG TPA: hypothetical protein VF676_07460 [Flavobacterium sp.]|jgi:hypothetical protein
MKVFYTAFIMGAITLISCKGELEPQESSAVAEATGAASPVAATAAAQSNSAVTYQQTAQNTGQLNPAHGQPGHRCEIAVGAPLPGTAQPTQAITSAPTQVTPQMVTSGAAQQPAKTAKGMNPAHGKPGHRCDIAVGAPLNSAPATKPAAANPNPVTMSPATINSNGTVTPGSGTNVTTTTTSGATPAMLKAPTTTAPGMNPPHGEAGHVCSVAVGAPLPK